MESKELVLIPELNRKIFQSFSDFMTRVAQFELVAVGSRFLFGLHRGLEFLLRPPIDKTSVLVSHIIKAIETDRVVKYVETGCLNAHDGVNNISKLRTCQLGLQDRLSKAKCIVNELEGLVKEVAGAMQTEIDGKSHLKDEFTGDEFGSESTTYDSEEIGSSDLQKPGITDYGDMMGIIYSMLKKDLCRKGSFLRLISSHCQGNWRATA